MENFWNFGKFLERLEKFEPQVFWLVVLIIPFVTSETIRPSQSVETLVVIEKQCLQINRCGGAADSNSSSLKINSLKQKTNVPSEVKGQPPVSDSSASSKVVVGEKIRPGYSPDPPDSPGGNNFTASADTIEPWTCPDPNSVISNSGFWTNLKKQDNPICEEEETEMDCLDEMEDQEPDTIRRKLLSFNVPASTPTWKLDQDYLKKFDFTTQKIQPSPFTSREGMILYIDHRSLKKIVYSHPDLLELYDLINRIPCPIQADTTKYCREVCWAITDEGMGQALIKVFQQTTFPNPKIITVQMPMLECPSNLATYFINKDTGFSIYFHADGKQAGKLWSVADLPKSELFDILNQPEVRVLTDYENGISVNMSPENQ